MKPKWEDNEVPDLKPIKLNPPSEHAQFYAERTITDDGSGIHFDVFGLKVNWEESDEGREACAKTIGKMRGQLASLLDVYAVEAIDEGVVNPPLAVLKKATLAIIEAEQNHLGDIAYASTDVVVRAGLMRDLATLRLRYDNMERLFGQLEGYFDWKLQQQSPVQQ